MEAAGIATRVFTDTFARLYAIGSAGPYFPSSIDSLSIFVADEDAQAAEDILAGGGVLAGAGPGDGQAEVAEERIAALDWEHRVLMVGGGLPKGALDELLDLADFEYLGGRGRPLCAIRTSAVELLPFREVGPEHAQAEGEGDLSLAYWRRVHEEFFGKECAAAGRAFRPGDLVLCEHFELIERFQD